MITDNETWIIDAGDAIACKRAARGPDALSPLERLIYCLWVADYGMRDAGDLTAAGDLYAAFDVEAAKLSQLLGLGITRSAFALSRSELERQYFQLFDEMCDELRAATDTDRSGC
jgi:hypothetical protein